MSESEAVLEEELLSVHASDKASLAKTSIGLTPMSPSEASCCRRYTFVGAELWARDQRWLFGVVRSEHFKQNPYLILVLQFQIESLTWIPPKARSTHNHKSLPLIPDPHLSSYKGLSTPTAEPKL